MQSNNAGNPITRRSGRIGTNQERFKNSKKRGAEICRCNVDDPTMAILAFDENLYILNMQNDAEAKESQVSLVVKRLSAINPDTVPPTSVMKQLAVAIEAGRKYKSMKDLLVSSGSSSPMGEMGSLSLTAVKSLVLWNKDDKLISEFDNNEKVSSLIDSLFNAEGSFLKRNIASDSEALAFSGDIHGAPPQSFIVKLSEVVGSFKAMWKMASFWCKTVAELRRHWTDDLHVPGIPMDEIPDLRCCLLYQKFQVINCCVSRKRRHILAEEFLESTMRNASPSLEDSRDDTIASVSGLHARLSSGELIQRLGTDRPAKGLTLLETGEPMYLPITQEEPLLTEDIIKETEEFVLRTGSVGAGCSRLLSDMQAFKAANPGCILEDFVRWHSPPDWTESEPDNDDGENTSPRTSSSTRKGQLSGRMRKEGNLWRELWETSKPMPAVKQTPLFDEDLAVEAILNDLEDIPPSELFGQMFISLLGLGLVMAEARLASNDELSKLFYEYKEYVTVICQRSSWSEKLDDLCQAYETIEVMLLKPEEALKTLKQKEETTTAEPTWSFKRLNLNFSGSNDRNLEKPLSVEDQKCSEEKQSSKTFAKFFDRKSSFFAKKSQGQEVIKQSSEDKMHFRLVHIM